jgi:GT2 family glycosyltransferase
VLRAFADERVGIVTGRILLHDASDAAITIRLDPDPVRYPAGRCVEPGAVQGANFACRRVVWEAVRGFDEELGAGTPFPCEDIDFAARALNLGWDGVYDPTPTVAHHHGRKPGLDERRIVRAYAYARGAYFAKCMLDPRLRMPVARHWIATRLELAQLRHPRAIGREIVGAVQYLMR